MRKINLYSHGGSANHGCEAIVRATAKCFDCKVTLFSAAPKEEAEYAVDQLTTVIEDIYVPVKKDSFAYWICALDHKLFHHDYQAIRFGHRKMLDHISKGDICLSIGGDNYCYSGTDKLGYLNQLLHKKGCKTVLWGCSVEPTALTTDVIADLKRYDLITVRETLSFDGLKKAGIVDNVVLCTDPAFQLDTVHTPLPSGFTSENTIGINVSPLAVSRGEQVMENYTALIRYILEETDFRVLLIPHVVKAENDDRDTLKRLLNAFSSSNRISIVDDRNCLELKSIISQCRIFVGARTHATIAAYSTCVPTLVVGYSIKARGIAKDIFGTDENYVVPVQKIDRVDCLKNAFLWIMQNEETIRGHLQECIPAYKEKTYIAVEAVKRMMRE